MTDKLTENQAAKSVDSIDWLVCEDCGKKREDALHTTCPYDGDVNGTTTPATLCNDCYNDRCLEI